MPSCEMAHTRYKTMWRFRTQCGESVAFGTQHMMTELPDECHFIDSYIGTFEAMQLSSLLNIFSVLKHSIIDMLPL